MASKAARYGVDIGTGAASGAATGATIGGPWGALIGGVVGGGAGAVTAAIGNADEDRAKRRMLQQQARERKLALIKLLGEQAREYGADTGVADTMLERRGLDIGQYNERKQFTLDHQIDPNAFVGMATAGTKAAGGIYKAVNAPQMTQPTSVPSMPAYPSLQNPGAYQLQDPQLPQGDEYALDPNRYRLSGGFQ
jgi:hypothetical protein